MSESEKQSVESAEAPGAIGPYSQAIRSSVSAYVFASGQIGVDPQSGDFVGDDVQEQAAQCLRNLLAVVKSAGGGPDSIVKTTIYLKRIGDFAAVNEVYSGFFKPPYPARACVGGLDLPKGAMVEIEAIAAVER
jgi:2-iminobutanoate/2-iminopropanoate deaminase